MEAPKRIVLDTTVMIGHLRDRGRESRLITRLQEEVELATTIVNAFELYFGAYKSKQVKRNLAAAKGFLATIQVLLLDDGSSERAGEVLADLERTGKPIDPKDLFIGCIAVEHGYAVLTHNTEHFQRIPQLVVIAPSEVETDPAKAGSN